MRPQPPLLAGASVRFVCILSGRVAGGVISHTSQGRTALVAPWPTSVDLFICAKDLDRQFGDVQGGLRKMLLSLAPLIAKPFGPHSFLGFRGIKPGASLRLTLRGTGPRVVIRS
jgi:hypothetical protein